MADEKTSPEVATHAARIANMSNGEILRLARTDPEAIRSVAASALTQTPKRKAKPKAPPPTE